jgi:hypothetical protein
VQNLDALFVSARLRLGETRYFAGSPRQWAGTNLPFV